MHYPEFLAELRSLADENYRDFHKRLLKNDEIRVLGVRVPQLRKLAKKYAGELDVLMDFPDEYYEVTFVKLTAVSRLDYGEFISYVDRCVPLIDNWATCDCFAPRCVREHREEFLPYLRRYAASEGEFSQRFALTTLLHYYVEERYLDEIFSFAERCDREKYYVHMAAAWLVAETLVKHYERAEEFLRKGSLDRKTHNKAIQKACESYRLSEDKKTYLKGIKR